MPYGSLVVPLFLMLPVLDPSVPDAQAARGRFDEGMRLMVLEQPRSAEARFEDAVQAEPDVAQYHYWLGRSVGMQAARAKMK
jgi:Tfp pilus assembly protein PilF